MAIPRIEVEPIVLPIHSGDLGGPLRGATSVPYFPRRSYGDRTLSGPSLVPMRSDDLLDSEGRQSHGLLRGNKTGLWGNREALLANDGRSGPNRATLARNLI